MTSSKNMNSLPVETCKKWNNNVNKAMFILLNSNITNKQLGQYLICFKTAFVLKHLSWLRKDFKYYCRLEIKEWLLVLFISTIRIK